MAYCGPRGIPLSRFLSWPVADQDAALAWQAHEARRCSGCGTHPEDWNELRGGDRWAYHTEQFLCPGCQQIDRRREVLERQGEKTDRAGVHIRLARGSAGDCPRCRPQPTNQQPAQRQPS